MSPKTVRIFGIVTIFIGILWTIGSIWAMNELGGMLVIILVLGPVFIGIGIYQAATGKFLGRGKKSS